MLAFAGPDQPSQTWAQLPLARGHSCTGPGSELGPEHVRHAGDERLHGTVCGIAQLTPLSPVSIWPLQILPEEWIPCSPAWLLCSLYRGALQLLLVSCNETFLLLYYNLLSVNGLSTRPCKSLVIIAVNGLCQPNFTDKRLSP